MRNLAVVAVALVMSGHALAGPKEDLRDADNSYLYADYPRVLEKIEPLIDPDLKLSDPNDIARAYELSGLAAFYLKDEKSARRYFEKLVRLRPDFRLDPVKVPPPAVAFFDGIRDQLADEIKRIQAALQKMAAQERELERKRNEVFIETDYQVNSRLTALLPFGIGQFQNGDRTFGQILLSSQVLTATSSVVLFFTVESLRSESGRFRSSDVGRARLFRSASMITGTTAAVLALIGIAEAQLNFRPRLMTDERRSRNTQLETSGMFQFSF